jgi:hypothetical protein
LQVDYRPRGLFYDFVLNTKVIDIKLHGKNAGIVLPSRQRIEVTICTSYLNIYGRRDSSVGVVTRRQAARLRKELGLVPGREQEDLHSFRTGPGAHFFGDKAAGREFFVGCLTTLSVSTYLLIPSDD